MRFTLIVAALLAMTACSSDTRADIHAYDGGGSSQWWSDHYLTMVQDANDVGVPNLPAATPAKKPVRMRIF